MVTGSPLGGGRRSTVAYPDVAQGRLTQDEEEQQRDRAEEEICSEPAVVDEEADDEPDQCHQEGRDRAHVGELVLEMVPWEDLAKPVLEAGLGGLAGRARRRCGGGHAHPPVRPRTSPETGGTGGPPHRPSPRAAGNGPRPP